MGFWNDRNVFVTGCTGFLGGWLTAELIRRPVINCAAPNGRTVSFNITPG